MGLVGGGQFSQDCLYRGERKPPVFGLFNEFLGSTRGLGTAQSSWLLKDIAGLCSYGWQDSLRPSLFRGNANGIGNRQIRAQY